MDRHPEEVPGIRPVEIHQVYLLPDHHRKGIGTKLIEELVRYAKHSMGGDGVFLSCWTKAEHAIHFYQKCGMYKVGSTIFRVGNDDREDWLMYKSL